MRRLTIAFLVTCILGALIGSAVAAQSASPGPFAPGPPYPDPVAGVRVYDHAGVLSDETILEIEAIIGAIEERSGAQVVVYTQVKPESDTYEETERDAVALIDQWGIGRAGIDDGLAILFDLQQDLCHGQVQLYAGPGFAAMHLSDAERQATFEEDMLPRLRECDYDAALSAAMERIDAATVSAYVVAVEDVYPADIGVAAFRADETDVLRGESDIVHYIFGIEPDPMQVMGLESLAAATGHRLDDMTQVWGGFRSDTGDVFISLAGLQLPGADTADLLEATRMWGLEMMGDPPWEELEIGGKRVTVFHTEEALGKPNYLYANGDIAWLVSTPATYAADVLSALPG